MPDPVIMSPTSPSSPDATALTARLDAELAERYPDLERSRLEQAPAQVAIGRGLFLIARVAGEPVGCGALRIIGSTMGEIKRMYVVPAARGKKIGRRLLTELEAYARDDGLCCLVLRTGRRQPEAIRLYIQSGFMHIPSFGGHFDSGIRVRMAKALVHHPHCTRNLMRR